MRKNKYLSVSKLSESKFRQIIRYYSEDFTSLQIAKLTHVNRNTVNLWINRIREKIYEQVEIEKLKNSISVQMDETFFCRPSKLYKKYKLISLYIFFVLMDKLIQFYIFCSFCFPFLCLG